MTFIDTLRTSRKESSLYRRAAQTRSFLSWANVAGALRYEQVRASPGACLNQTAAARNKGSPPLTFDIRV
uniref:SFRICE_035892 n=1 Tax=Spodoptera frugiperda TaxID=7108 RepID=A0A2H1WUR3_SPOFR